MRCGGCNLIQHCSVKCRNEDWTHHKELVQLSDVGHVKYLAATWLLLYVSLMGTLLCLSVFAGIAFATAAEVVFLIFLEKKNTRHPLLQLHHCDPSRHVKVNYTQPMRTLQVTLALFFDQASTTAASTQH